MMMLQVADLHELVVNTLQDNDAKKWEEPKGRRKIVFVVLKSKMGNKPHPCIIPSNPRGSNEPRSSTPIKTPTEKGD